MEPCQPERSAWHRRALSTAAALAAPGGADPGQWTARASTTAPATTATRARGRELLGRLPRRHHGRGRPGREHARPGPVDRGQAGQADRQGAGQARHRRERRPREAGQGRRASRPDPGWTGRAGSVNTSLRRSPTMANERIISADSHVNPPKDLWTSRAPAKFSERAPRVESTPQGDFWIVDSQVSGGIGLDASAGHKPEEFRPVGMTYKDMRPGSYDPKARLADMDLDGVDAEVLYFGGPISFHIVGPRNTNLQQTFMNPTPGVKETFIAIAPISICEVVSTLVFTGILARHPKLHFVLVECGIGWIPYFVERMDQTFNKHRFWTKSVITEKPSTYWYHQGHATFIQDLAGVAARHRAGLRNIMWSTDYPHSDSTWPKSREALAAHFQDVPESERALIAGGNAAALYGLN